MNQTLKISRGTLFLILGSMAALTPISLDMYLPAVPVLVENLRGDAAQGQWTLASYFLGMSVGQLFYGLSSDKLGRRPIYFAGMALYFVATLGCALAGDIKSVIALRFLQAVGACGAAVISRAVVFDLFESHEAAKFLSRMLLIQGLAPILAPLLGGWIAVTAGWRGVFFFLAAFAVLTGAAAYFLMPETRTKESRAHSQSETTLNAYLAVLRNWPLMQVSLAGSLGSASFFTYLSNAPQLLIGAFHIPPENFGYVFGANAIGFVGCAQINRALLSRFTPSVILNRAIFVTLGAGVLLLIGSKLTGAFGMWSVLAPLFVLTASFSFVLTNAMAIAQSYDKRRPGAVAAVSGSVSFAAGAATASLSGRVFDGTATPMALIIVCCAAAAALLCVTSARPPASIASPPR